MGAKYCGNSQVQDQGGEEKGKHHFHHFVAQVSGLRRYLKALMVPSQVCALQLKHKAAIRSLFDQVTRTLVLEVNHLRVAGEPCMNKPSQHCHWSQILLGLQYPTKFIWKRKQLNGISMITKPWFLDHPMVIKDQT